MKTNNRTEGPDISALIDDITANQEQPKPSGKSKLSPVSDDIIQGRLWKEFVVCLNDPDEEPSERTKLYAIDDDIVETLHQCNFGKPNVSVINSILRTFLVDNIERLREMRRPKSNSLLDKY